MVVITMVETESIFVYMPRCIKATLAGCGKVCPHRTLFRSPWDIMKPEEDVVGEEET